MTTPAPLEIRLGDPDDPANPLGYAAVLAADERGDPLPAGIAALEAFGLGAHFVPRSLGGKFGQVDELAGLLRVLFRRDAALGLGEGAINLIASATVWAAGSAQQRKQLASVLLRGGRTAGAYTELDSGHDLTRAQLRATRDGGEFLLRGRKEVINNVARADAVTVLARTSDEPGSRSHSLFLLDPATIDRSRVRFLPRYRTSGLRAMQLGGIEFLDCPLPESTVVGPEGGALETVLRAFQVTKAALCAATVGMLDTQLRVVTRFALERTLYQRRVAALPHARRVLAGAYADLMICDAFASTVCRALHLLPGQTSGYAAAVKYLVPLLMREAADRLAVVLGARSFLREGEHGIFGKHLRDLPVAALAHTGPTVCQAQLVPQLPRLATRSWLRSAPAPDELFRLGEPLPELDFPALAITARPDDALMATLAASAEELRGHPRLGPLSANLLGELRTLREVCIGLGPRQRTPLAEPASFELAERYSILLAAAACLGVWRQRDDDPAWLELALVRLTGRLGYPAPDTAAAQAAVFAELTARHQDNRAFDLTGRGLA